MHVQVQEPRRVTKPDPSKGELRIEQVDYLHTVLERISCGPDVIRTLAPVMKKLQGKPRFVPNEANANKYIKADGHMLQPHYDDRQLSGPVLANLSLAGAAVMTYDNTGGKGPPVRVPLPPRALQLVTGEARYDWRHAIKVLITASFDSLARSNPFRPRAVSVSLNH